MVLTSHYSSVCHLDCLPCHIATPAHPPFRLFYAFIKRSVAYRWVTDEQPFQLVINIFLVGTSFLLIITPQRRAVLQSATLEIWETAKEAKARQGRGSQRASCWESCSGSIISRWQASTSKLAALQGSPKTHPFHKTNCFGCFYPKTLSTPKQPNLKHSKKRWFCDVHGNC